MDDLWRTLLYVVLLFASPIIIVIISIKASQSAERRIKERQDENLQAALDRARNTMIVESTHIDNAIFDKNGNCYRCSACDAVLNTKTTTNKRCMCEHCGIANRIT